jgi:hypothetical protein
VLDAWAMHATARATPSLPKGISLRKHRGFDPCEAAQDHRSVEVAQVADAEGLAIEGPEPSRERDLEALARDAAQRVDVDALAHLDGRDRRRSRLGDAQCSASAPSLAQPSTAA